MNLLWTDVDNIGKTSVFKIQAGGQRALIDWRTRFFGDCATVHVMEIDTPSEGWIRMVVARYKDAWAVFDWSPLDGFEGRNSSYVMSMPTLEEARRYAEVYAKMHGIDHVDG